MISRGQNPCDSQIEQTRESQKDARADIADMLGLEDEHAHETQEDAFATLVLQKVYVLDYRSVVQFS